MILKIWIYVLFSTAQQQSPISLLSKQYKTNKQQQIQTTRPELDLPLLSLASFFHLQKSILVLSFLTSSFLHLYHFILISTTEAPEAKGRIFPERCGNERILIVSVLFICFVFVTTTGGCCFHTGNPLWPLCREWLIGKQEETRKIMSLLQRSLSKGDYRQ